MQHQQPGLGALTASPGDTRWLWGQIWSKTRQLNFTSQTECPCPVDTVNNQSPSSERINPGDSEAGHPICHVTTFSFWHVDHLCSDHLWLRGDHFTSKLSSACPTVFLTGHSHSFPSALLVFLLYHSICVLGPLEPIFLNTNTGLHQCLFCPWNSTNTFTEPNISIFLLHLHRTSRSILLPWFACWIYTWIHSPSQKALGTSDKQTDSQLPWNWQSGREHAHQPANDTVFMELQMGQVVQMRGAEGRDYVRWDNLGCGQQQNTAVSRTGIFLTLPPGPWTSVNTGPIFLPSSATLPSLPKLLQGIISLTMITNIQELTLSCPPPFPVLSSELWLYYFQGFLYLQLQCFRITSNSTY